MTSKFITAYRIPAYKYTDSENPEYHNLEPTTLRLAISRLTSYGSNGYDLNAFCRNMIRAVVSILEVPQSMLSTLPFGLSYTEAEDSPSEPFFLAVALLLDARS